MLRRLRSPALFWMKHLPQVSQLKGRSPLCIRLWPFRVSAWLKLLPQVSHLNGFSPVCMRRCDLLLIKALPHTVVNAYRKLSPHSEHLCGFSTLCTTW
uniref:Uncharacterized protein n=1 Tax=Sander lucioperca TaxID=283035 RepID=A0A8C9YI90_SANLU